jgi:hypothetical protein
VWSAVVTSARRDPVGLIISFRLRIAPTWRSIQVTYEAFASGMTSEVTEKKGRAPPIAKSDMEDVTRPGCR